MPSYKAILFEVLIFFSFAFIHSILVTDTAKRLVASRMGDVFVKSVYRFLFTCLSLLSVLIVIIILIKIPDKNLITLPVWLKILFHLIQLIGIMFLILPFRSIDIFEYTGIKQILTYLKKRNINGDIEGIKQTGLMTEGIYGVVRHPLYLGGILIFTFNPHITQNMLTLSILADLYFIIGALIEKKRLKKRFGNVYINYMKDVPMFIPFA